MSTDPVKSDIVERLRAALKEQSQRLGDAELALAFWDEGRNSEYWLRYETEISPPSTVRIRGAEMSDLYDKVADIMLRTENQEAMVRAIVAATIEECARVAYDCCEHGADIADAIRALKEQK